MHYVKKVSKLAVVVGFLLLAACSQAPTPHLTDTNGDFEKVATVSISSTDTEASLEAKYGGKVVLLNKEAGLAMLGFYAGDFTALNTTSNTGAFGTPEVTAAGTSAWGGGKNAWGGGKNAWGGGWNAWGGGWKAWGGGTTAMTAVPTLPSENRTAWRNSKLPEAQALSRNFGAGIKVAVLDTGLDLNHPMFSGRLAPASEWKDFVDNDATPQEVSGSSYGHGTAVAGIILQAAPRATILPLRVLNSAGVGDTDKIAAAIDWAIQKDVKIINMSLGTNVQATAMQSWVGYALSRGIYVVASSGNSGDTNITFPAGDATSITYSGVNYSKYLLSVGSMSNSWTRSSFSTYGNSLELVASGEQIFTAFPDNQTGHATGTSFAAPQVSGVLAMAMSDTAAANHGNMQQYISWTSWSMGAGYGYGAFNAVGLMANLPGRLVRKALLVVEYQGTNAILPGDLYFKNRLEWNGYSVTVKDQDEFVLSHTTGQDVILVASSVSASTFGAKVRDVAIPVVTWEEEIFDDMRFNTAASGDANNWATGDTQTHVRMVNSSHPLAAGYTGDVKVFDNVNQMPWSQQMASGAIKIATTTFDSNKTSIFGFDKGAQMIGMVAPARRVGLFHNYYGAANSSHAGNFFDAAVTWAVTGN